MVGNISFFFYFFIFIANCFAFRSSSHTLLPGFVYTQTTDRLWRKNRQPVKGISCPGGGPGSGEGRDIARNWPYQWDVPIGGASTDPCDERFKGYCSRLSKKAPTPINIYVLITVFTLRPCPGWCNRNLVAFFPPEYSGSRNWREALHWLPLIFSADPVAYVMFFFPCLGPKKRRLFLLTKAPPKKPPLENSIRLLLWCRGSHQGRAPYSCLWRCRLHQGCVWYRVSDWAYLHHHLSRFWWLRWLRLRRGKSKLLVHLWA